jgi:hypothetical protein
LVYQQVELSQCRLSRLSAGLFNAGLRLQLKQQLALIMVLEQAAAQSALILARLFSVVKGVT